METYVLTKRDDIVAFSVIKICRCLERFQEKILTQDPRYTMSSC